jgi:hypothetical protein
LDRHAVRVMRDAFPLRSVKRHARNPSLRWVVVLIL